MVLDRAPVNIATAVASHTSTFGKLILQQDAHLLNRMQDAEVCDATMYNYDTGARLILKKYTPKIGYLHNTMGIFPFWDKRKTNFLL